MILLVVVALVLSHGISRSELYFYGDESHHAMDGVFFRDLLVDHPFSHPLQYAYQYYAKYPAIALPHWPPLFPLVEGFFFLILGISAGASHWCVLSFALVGVYFWYRIAEQAGPRSRALLSALLFALLPFVLTFETTSMLEIPGVAMCLGAIYFWRRWLDTGSQRCLWALAGFAAGALLASQSSIVLIPFLGLDFVFERRFRLLRSGQVWAALAAGSALVVPWYLLSFRTLTMTYQRAVHHSVAPSMQRWSLLYYPRALPQQLGFVLLGLSVVGIAWALVKSARQYRFLLLWLIATYACFTLIQEKEPRHTMIWIPPLVYFALLGVEFLLPRRRLALAGSAALALYFLIVAIRFPRPWLSGVEPATRYVLAQPGSDIVYYQGALSGDFVFTVRSRDPQKRRMVATDKQVVVTNIVYARRPILRTPNEVLAFFRTWGIRYAVVESKDPGPGFASVHQLLDSSQFQLLRTFPVTSNDPHYANDTISVYRYGGQLGPSRGRVEIPMLTIRHNIDVDLGRLAGRPWPD